MLVNVRLGYLSLWVGLLLVGALDSCDYDWILLIALIVSLLLDLMFGFAVCIVVSLIISG